MITKVFLTNKPRKSIDYPDCYPMIVVASKSIHIRRLDKSSSEAIYNINIISKIEYRP